MSYRIGLGEDIHPLVKGRPLILGGVHIPFELGLDGVSDADIIYHALSDALLGSLALGDIGQLFPPSDPASKGLDSSKIVSKCYGLVKEKGYEVVNLDICIALERPKLKDYLIDMRKNIANLLECEIEEVSIKAMTNEGFDAIGNQLAAMAKAIVLVRKVDGK